MKFLHKNKVFQNKIYTFLLKKYIDFYTFLSTLLPDLYQSIKVDKKTPAPFDVGVMIYLSFENIRRLSEFFVSVDGCVPKLLFNPDELIVLCHTVGATHGSGLYLSGICRNGYVRNRGVLGFA